MTLQNSNCCKQWQQTEISFLERLKNYILFEDFAKSEKRDVERPTPIPPFPENPPDMLNE